MNQQPSLYEQFLDIVPEELHKSIKDIFRRMILGELTDNDAKANCVATIGNSQPIEMFLRSIDVPNEPLPTFRFNSDQNSKEVKNWSSYEDQRLIAGIKRFGSSDWSKIGEFVGNGRNRLQCMQRWQRSLNPLINKSQWTQEEDKMLLEAVNKFGKKKWIKVSNTIPGRTDVQCRYRYQIISRKYPKGHGLETFENENQTTNPENTYNKQEHEELFSLKESSPLSEANLNHNSENLKIQEKEQSDLSSLFLSDVSSTEALLELINLIPDDPFSIFNIF